MSGNITKIAVIIVAAIAGKFGLDYALDAMRPNPTPASMEQAILASPAAPTYRAIRTYFPDDADAWLDQMVVLELKRRDGTLQPGEAIDTGAVIRQKYAPHLAKAPDESLIDVMGFQVQLHELYETNTNACNRLLMQGPTGLNKQELTKIHGLLEQTEVQIKAMHDGLTRPQNHAPASDADWDAFYMAYVQAGFSDADFDLVMEPVPDDPRLCGAFMGFFRTLRDADFEGASRIRAQVVPFLVGA